MVSPPLTPSVHSPDVNSTGQKNNPHTLLGARDPGQGLIKMNIDIFLFFLFSDWKVSCQVKEKDRYHIGDWQQEIDIIIFLS